MSNDMNESKYRKCVGVMIVNKNKKVFVAERIDFPGSFQMPQGGVEDDEEPNGAIIREIEEETGIKNIEILSCMPEPIEYTIPHNHIPHHWNGEFIGQSILFFLARFTGEDSEINLNYSKNPEFKSWKWVDLSEVPNCGVIFKRALYKQVHDTFKSIISIVSNNYKILDSVDS